MCQRRHQDPAAANNGILSGFVAITGGCGVVQPEGAVLIGAVAGVIYQGASALLLKLRIDDGEHSTTPTDV
jgi:ammonium transporter, Amt family